MHLSLPVTLHAVPDIVLAAFVAGYLPDPFDRCSAAAILSRVLLTNTMRTCTVLQCPTPALLLQTQ
jgi:hypothetical protein